MDRTLLRTLTEKSTMGFGKFNDLRVGDLLKLGKWAYLRWVYFNCSMISFIPSVLIEIQLNKDWEILKPGIDKELGIEYEERYGSQRKRYGLEKYVINKITKKIIKGSANRAWYRQKDYYSKGSMQRRNQGH